MRSILLHIHADPCLEARLQLSLDLARAFGAHLTCLQVIPFDFVVPGDFYGTLAAEMVPVLKKGADELREELAARLRNEDVAWDWRQEEGQAVQSLLQASSLSDLVVMGACDPVTQNRSPSRLAGELAIRALTPVMIVPQSVRVFDVHGTAIVGWNGSVEAAHALKGALPLLANAQSVILASAIDETERPGNIPSARAAEYLSRHRVGCEILELPLEGGSAAQVLERTAAARKASYLVIGAYGHNRLAEAVWGGVTRDLLSAPPLPILAGH